MNAPVILAAAARARLLADAARDGTLIGAARVSSPVWATCDGTAYRWKSRPYSAEQ